MSLEALRDAPWLHWPETQTLFAVLDGRERRTRAVGGIVRDTILDRLRPDTDLDLATELVPPEVIARAEANNIAVYPTGIDHGTVTLRLGEVSTEVTTLRQDVETDGRHAVVAFGRDWVADASRRDFTLNALYCDWDGTLFDPLGGIGDTLGGRVRFIGQADRRIAEDGLRVFRFFRFSASHGDEQFDPDGLRAAQTAVGKLDAVSRERVGAEMLRMLALPHVTRTLAVMDSIGLVSLSHQALSHLERYEALGGRSPAARLLLMGESAPTMQSRWRLSGDLVKAIERIEKAADLAGSMRLGEAAYRYGDLAVEGLAVAAVYQGWTRDLLAEYAREIGRMVIPRFPVTGHDLAGLGMKPGPAVGQALQRLERAWIESGFALGRSDLLALLAD